MAMFSSKSDYLLTGHQSPTMRLRGKRFFKLIGLGLAGGAILLIANQWRPSHAPAAAPNVSNLAQKSTPPAQPAHAAIDKAFLRRALSDSVRAGNFPATIKQDQQSLHIRYTLDQNLQSWAEQRLQKYNPDYGVFVALDPDSGKVLAMATSRRDEQASAELALNATYPAASTFKLVTAAAALSEGIATPDTVFAFNGKSTSLYKKQVFKVKENRWTRHMTLKAAFAKSVNPIFGRIGAQELGSQRLLDYAERFGFNAQFVSDFEFDNGSISIEPNDEWQAAEAASGYTRANTLSPIHGAVLAASVINGGKLIPPSIVERVTDDENRTLYTSGQPAAIEVLDEKTANAMQKLMRATITEGTGRKSFRKFSRRKFGDVVIGGKTGHLRGFAPKGTYDWFIGYGEGSNRKIAYAMLCINKEKWYVKSSVFAREALEHFFQEENTRITENTPQKNQAGTS